MKSATGVESYPPELRRLTPTYHSLLARAVLKITDLLPGQH